MGLWILRRLELRIAATPRFRAEVTARTWCSGIGARWAERTHAAARRRRAVCRGDRALGAHRSRTRARRSPLPAGFDAVWGATADGRKVSARLRHAAPPAGRARVAPWPLRATDLDVVGHVNNAAYWAAVEDELAAPRAPAGRTRGDRVPRRPRPRRPGRARSSPTPTTASRPGSASTATCARRSS